VYRDQPVSLPTGLAQAAYTRFLRLPLFDQLSAFPLALALADFDDSPESWARYDSLSFRESCNRLGVSPRCYDEAFEPMILTGLFAPGSECSAAAALGMAYFFVLQSQTAFDVRWCRGNIGSTIFDPWIHHMKEAGVDVRCSTRVVGFEIDTEKRVVRSIECQSATNEKEILPVDDVIFAVGAQALNSLVRASPVLARYPDFAKFSNLRGTSVLATRLYLDRNVAVRFSANACWGFDKGVGMTMFDIKTLHGDKACNFPGSVLEVDYYHANTLLVLSDDDLVAKVKSDLDNLLGLQCARASVVDFAFVRLPSGVNWYFPGSYQYMPDVCSESLENVFFAGDIVRTRHGSWSQEKAFVTGIQAANSAMGRPADDGIIPMYADENHVKLGKTIVSWFRGRVIGNIGKQA
jgi:uncharacterized protein with NAD-binding domain and iron-sulfur cluster